jgi:molybdate transport system permease protein
MGILLALLCMTSTEAQPAKSQPELTVSAASSLRDVMNDLRDASTVQATVLFNFGGTNHLQRQIEANHGEGVDILVAAGDDAMRALTQLGLIREGDLRIMAENRMALVAPSDHSGEIQSFADLAHERVTRIAVGARGVPVGNLARQVFDALGISEQVRPKLVGATHARQALDYIIRGEVSAGVLYTTDARAAGDKVIVIQAADPSWHDPIRYWIAPLISSDNPDAANAFVDFAVSEPARAILRGHGFQAGDDNVVAATLETSDKESERVFSRAWTALRLSVTAAFGALLVVFPLGTIVGAVLARKAFRGREVVDSILTLPMILPPTVTGYILVVLLGSQSVIGSTLESVFGVRVSLTLVGAGVASGVIAFPLMMKSARAGFAAVDRDLELASYTLGKGRLATFFRISVPLARNGLITGAVLSFARAIGEFGATYMLAGMIENRTMTMPSAIFDAFTNHHDATARTLVLILTAFSLFVIYFTNRLNVHESFDRSRTH